MTISSKRWLYVVWAAVISVFALLHAVNLSADFPSNTKWLWDGSPFTDEGWWGNAAIHAQLNGNWYSPLGPNPAPVVPVWPFLEWVLFSVTGVSLVAARGLVFAFYIANLAL